jgi:iron complex outermembrane receptor protein
MPHPRTCRSIRAGVPFPRPAPLPFLACLIWACALSPIRLHAAEDTLELREKRAEKKAPPPTGVAKTVIVPTDVDRQLGSLADMLQRAAGLHVVRTGGLGDYVGVSVWGSSEQQVNVYVNGVLQNQANDGSTFLGDWDLSRVERVEVYKGLAPDDLAGSPMGGAINIITRGAAPGPRARGALGAGSFGSLRANGAVEYGAGGWRGRAEAARNQADGDFPYYDDNGTEFEPGRHPEGAKRLTEDQLTRKIRRNNAHAFSEIAVDLAYADSGEWDAGVRADATRLHKQIPSPNADSEEASTFRDSDRLFLSGFGHWTGHDAEASLTLSGTFQGDAYVDTVEGGRVGFGRDDDYNAYSDLIATAWARAQVKEGFTVSALGSYGVSTYRFTDRQRDRDYPLFLRYSGDGKITPAYSRGRHTLEAILAATVTLEEQFDGGLYAYNHALAAAEDWDAHASVRLGYQFRIRQGLWVSAQGGTTYRIPTFLERFGDRGIIVASAGLKPEAGATGSLGLHAEGRGLNGDVQGFATAGENIITLQQVSPFALTYHNTEATRVFGAEARLAAFPRRWTRTELDLTVQKAVSASGGTATDGDKLIPYRPLSQASLRQSLMYGRWTLSGSGYYQGLAYPNPSNQASIFDSYSHNSEWQMRCDADLSWRAAHLMLAAGVRNIFDQRLFDFFTFPLPGRSFAATVQAEY